MKKIRLLVLMVLATILLVPNVVKADSTPSVSVTPNRSIKAGDEVTITVDYGNTTSNMFFDANIDCSLFNCADIKKEDITIDGQAIKSNEKATYIGVNSNVVSVNVQSTSNPAPFQTIEMKVVATKDITSTTTIKASNIKNIGLDTLKGKEASTSIVVPDPTKYTISVDPAQEVKVGDTVIVTLKWEEPTYESYFDFSFLANALEVSSYKAFDSEGNEVALANSVPTPMEKAATYNVSAIPTDGKLIQTVQLVFTAKDNSAETTKISVWNIANDIVLYRNAGLNSEALEITLIKNPDATSSTTPTSNPEETTVATQTNDTGVANPQTLDNILTYVFLTLVSVITITFCGYKIVRKVRN